VLGGAIVGPEALIEDVRWNTTEFVGAVLQPFEAWLTLQFLETLSLRMQRHSENAQKVAEFLAAHDRVQHVNYPGLPQHPQHQLATQQMSAPGGMLSFVVSGGIQVASRVINAFQLITHAVTFGTSRSICMHPATITHEHMTQQEREKAGIPDGLIRLSVGLEDAEDLISDLKQALEA
jgi:cystathionine beta-lyase/cystathionine gamma-synthase